MLEIDIHVKSTYAGPEARTGRIRHSATRATTSLLTTLLIIGSGRRFRRRRRAADLIGSCRPAPTCRNSWSAPNTTTSEGLVVGAYSDAPWKRHYALGSWRTLWSCCEALSQLLPSASSPRYQH